MAIRVKSDIKISTHNWNEFETVMQDMSLAVFKLFLVYQFIGNHGFTNEADTLLGEAISMAGDQQAAYKLFFECVSDGKEFNPD